MELFLLCLKVFFARILDVSMGTFRTIITVKGKNFYASVVGFFEILIWFLVVKEVLNTDNNSIWIAISYCLGFATGTYLGGILSNKFISGNLTVQIITDSAYPKLVHTLREEGYAVTVIDVKGKEENEKFMLFIEINNKNLDHLQKIVKEIDHDAFIVVNETKSVQNGFIGNVVK